MLSHHLFRLFLFLLAIAAVLGGLVLALAFDAHASPAGTSARVVADTPNSAKRATEAPRHHP